MTCQVIVQAQYDISMSSPDEESAYEPPYMALNLSDNTDDSSTASAASEDASDVSFSSDIDVTGSDSVIDLESVSDSNTNFGQDINSDYLDSEGSILAHGTSNRRFRNLMRPTENGLRGANMRLAKRRKNVKSVGSPSATHSTLLSLSSDSSRQNQCASDDEDKISHKAKTRAPDDLIIISSSEDDDSVSLHRNVLIKKKKNIMLSESEESKSTIDVEHLFPSTGESGGEGRDSEVNVEVTLSPVKLTPGDICWLGAGPSSSSTPNAHQQSAKRALAFSSKLAKTSRGKARQKVQKNRKRSRKRKSRKRSKRRRLKPASRPNSSTYLESMANNSLQRARARTAATHTPRVNAMRQAVQESYRHQDETEGLEWARAILVNARQSPRGNSRLLDNYPSSSGVLSSPGQTELSKIKSLSENKSTTSEDDCSFQRDPHKPLINRTYGFVPNRLDSFHPSQTHAGSAKSRVTLQHRHSVSDKPNDQPLTLEDRRKAEIQRRIVSNTSATSNSPASPTKSQAHIRNAKKRRNNSVSSQSMASPNLVDILCKNLDDLENKCEIKKDGTVVPISKSVLMMCVLLVYPHWGKGVQKNT